MKALGRGLSNLIPGNNTKIEPTSSDVDPNSNLKSIKLSEIVFNPNQPRKFFSKDSILELAETIKNHGVIQPIVVIRKNDGYELVSGERRVRACKEAGFLKIPAIIKNYSEQDILEVALIENIQREDLNPIEEAMAYHQLTEKLSLKVSDVAVRLGKNRSTISNLIRLLQLPEFVKDLIKDKKLSEGHARPLLSVGDSKKVESLAQLIVDKNLTVRQVEDMVAKIMDGKSNKSPKKENTEPEIVQIESKVRNKLSAKVSISHNSKVGKGKITVSYNTLEDLERILSNMGVSM